MWRCFMGVDYCCCRCINENAEIPKKFEFMNAVANYCTFAFRLLDTFTEYLLVQTFFKMKNKVLLDY